jgi:hypothetical protein
MTAMHTADGGRPAAMAVDWMAVHGPALVEMGYPIIPIIPGAKCPGKFRQSTGWQAYPDWPRHGSRPTKALELSIWEKWPGCGIGMAAGNIGGLDLDVLNAEINDELRRLAFLELGETPAERIGLAPKRLLVYRMVEPFAKIANHPLEFLGVGSQFVCYGIHPDTQRPYQWPMEDLSEILPTRLPFVTEEQIRGFMTKALALLPPELRQKRLGPDRSSDYYYSGGELEGTPEAVAAALDHIPNDDMHYDDWLYICQCVKGALPNGGEGLWCAWSATSSKDNPPVTLRTWRGMKPRHSIGAGTLYYYAKEYGWTAPNEMILRGSLAKAMATVDFSGILAQPVSHDPETGEVHEEEPAATADAAADEGGERRQFSDGLPPVIIGEQYRDLPRREMLVKGLMGAGELSVTYGAPKTGKSFLLTSVALAVACGTPDWFGHRIKRRGLVIYCTMEGAGGFPNRLAAWADKTGQRVPDTFAYVPVRLRFLSDPSGPLHRRRKALAEDIVRLARLVSEMEALSGLPCVLLVVDTVARAMTGRDENSTQDMGEFVDACAELQTLPNRPHVALVHHESKGGTMRGSGALTGAGDTMIRVQRLEDGSRQWAVELSKDDADGEDHAFDLELVTLGQDDDGDDITSCVITDQGTPAKQATKAKPQSVNERVLSALADAIAKDGITPPPGYDIPVTYVVSSGLWSSGEDHESRAAAVRRSKRALLDAGKVDGAGEFVWLADTGAQNAAQIIRSTKGRSK